MEGRLATEISCPQSAAHNTLCIFEMVFAFHSLTFLYSKGILSHSLLPIEVLMSLTNRALIAIFLMIGFYVCPCRC